MPGLTNCFSLKILLLIFFSQSTAKTALVTTTDYIYDLSHRLRDLSNCYLELMNKKDKRKIKKKKKKKKKDGV